MPTLNTEQRDEILLVKLNRPERRNALNLALLKELIAVLSTASSNEKALHSKSSFPVKYGKISWIRTSRSSFPET